MKPVSLRAAAIFNMSFGQVFIAGGLEGSPALIGPSRWQLLVNGQHIADLEAVGEQLPKGGRPDQRVIAYKGQLDTSTIDVAADEVILLKVDELQ